MDTLTSSAPPAPVLPTTRPESSSAPDVYQHRFHIPADIISHTCEALPDEHRKEIKWASGFCRARNLTPGEFGALLRQPGREEPYSRDSVYQAFTGRRDPGSMERFCESIAEFRKKVDETSPRVGTAFVETTLTRKIFAACRAALERQKLTFIFGASQIGKTTALAEYASRYNHGETTLLRMPTRGCLGDLLEEMALRLGIGAQTRQRELRRRIIECFDARTLLIVDECHQCLSSSYVDRGLASLEFLREIWDRRKCGLVLCGTDVFRLGLKGNKVLRQLWLRGYRPLQLPAVPSESNLAEFARAFGLDPAPATKRSVSWSETDDNGRESEQKADAVPVQLQASVTQQFGLGRWLSILEDASEEAKDEGKKLSWGRVIAVHARLQALEAGK